MAEGLAVGVDDLALLPEEEGARLALDALSLPVGHLAQWHYLLPIAIVPVALSFGQVVVLVALHTFALEVCLRAEWVNFDTKSEGKDIAVIALKTLPCVVVVALALILHGAAPPIGSQVEAIEAPDAMVPIEA